MITTVFFDLGGVIFYDFFSGADKEFVDSLGLSQKQIFNAYLETDFVEYVEGKMDDVERWKMFTNKLNLPESEIQTCIDAFYRGYKPIKEVVVFIQKLKQDFSNLKLGVLSDQPERVTKFLRHQYGKIFSLFDEKLVLISTEVRLSKQAENLKFYHEALRRAKEKPNRVLLVDNSMRNIKKAASVDMQGFFFDIGNEDIKSLINKLRREINQLVV